MFLLINFCCCVTFLFSSKFTIQNVSINLPVIFVNFDYCYKFTIQNVSINVEADENSFDFSMKFTIQNVSINPSSRPHIFYSVHTNLQYKMFLLILSSLNCLSSIPFFLIFVDTNFLIYFYLKFLFIFLYNSQKIQ